MNLSWRDLGPCDSVTPTPTQRPTPTSRPTPTPTTTVLAHTSCWNRPPQQAWTLGERYIQGHSVHPRNPSGTFNVIYNGTVRPGMFVAKQTHYATLATEPKLVNGVLEYDPAYWDIGAVVPRVIRAAPRA